MFESHINKVGTFSLVVCVCVTSWTSRTRLASVTEMYISSWADLFCSSFSEEWTNMADPCGAQNQSKNALLLHKYWENILAKPANGNMWAFSMFLGQLVSFLTILFKEARSKHYELTLKWITHLRCICISASTTPFEEALTKHWAYKEVNKSLKVHLHARLPLLPDYNT